jgi:aminobenzoyl-glutamate transport protein
LQVKRKSLTERYLDFVERGVDRLPDPFFLFAILAVIVLILSYIGNYFSVSAVHPGTGDNIHVVNLISKSGISRVLTDAVANFVNFPPLGVVLVTVIGIGVADKSGFFKSALTQLTQIVPKPLITLLFIFLSINSSIMADSGVVLMPPLGALLYAGIGKHPLAGLAAGFVGVSGGFSANIAITGLDPLLSGLTDPAAKLIDSAYNVFPTANYYFMFVSTFLVTFVINFVTNKIIEPRIKNISISSKSLSFGNELVSLDKTDKKALILSYISGAIFLAAVAFMTIPQNGLLRDENGSLLPFYKSIIMLLMLGFFICGSVFGFASKKVTTGSQLIKMSSDMMNTMGGYIVLSFIIAQFIAYFNWSNLGLVTAIKGADFLKNAGLTGVPLVGGFLLFTMIINIFISSASAKWAVLSTVFVPMFMLLGLPPEVTQGIYRVGDSVTNFVTPMFPYFPIIIVFAKEISPEITFGKLISILVPYSFALSIIWGIFLILWIFIGIPMGPDVPAFLKIAP